MQSYCAHYWDGISVQPLTDAHSRVIASCASQASNRSYCIALSYRPVNSGGRKERKEFRTKFLHLPSEVPLVVPAPHKLSRQSSIQTVVPGGASRSAMESMRISSLAPCLPYDLHDDPLSAVETGYPKSRLQLYSNANHKFKLTTTRPSAFQARLDLPSGRSQAVPAIIMARQNPPQKRRW